MKVFNKYYYHAHINEAKFRHIIRLFVEDLPASKIAQLSDVSRISVNKLMYKLRSRIVLLTAMDSPVDFDMTITDDYIQPFSDNHDGIADKNFVCGLLWRNDKVHVEIIPERYRLMLQEVIRGKRDIRTVQPARSWYPYDMLIDVEENKRARLHHSDESLLAHEEKIHQIAAFWSFVTRRLAMFNGINIDKYYLHLKECEFRFNNRHENLSTLLLREFTRNPL
ncbi:MULTISPECIES: IS1595 family transposase [Snodgrassella]|uniref:IS1595 family transposase n=1 Tax=Snodgrassella TaxID=1193515 RepID=UPI00226ABA81|nr:IS1595 family transposase [Snodgrassella sp. B3837]MCX8753250.1 IS1595 family transposase [Snodgrassella sp. B3837]